MVDPGSPQTLDEQEPDPSAEPAADEPRADAPSDFDADGWFESMPGGPRLSEDFVDERLANMARRPSVLQLLLVLVVMAFGAFVAWSLRLDVRYYFADPEPLDLGSVEELAPTLARDPDFLDTLPTNRYVHVEGIPQRRSVAGDQQFAQLVGAPIFVESPRQDMGANPILRDVRMRINPNEEPLGRYYVDTEGRLLRFEDLGRRYRGLVEFYRDGYDIWFCGEPLTRRQEDFRQLTRSDLRAELGREPTETELDAAFHCVEGFLVQAGRKPTDHLWYVAAAGFIALIELIGLWYAVRWALQMRAALRS